MRSVDRVATTRQAGSVPALASAGVALVTAGIYVAVIVTQGTEDTPSTVAITASLLLLGGCAFVGAIRRSSDRVIALGAATGGMIGAAVLSLLSIGALLFVAGVLALIAWVRAGVDATSRQQLLAGVAGLGAALAYLLVVIVVNVV
jgi:hypothetical protein